jgi:hypothetical protein
MAITTDRNWWLMRADACRETAETSPSESVRARMLGFASRYEALAESVATEEQAKDVIGQGTTNLVKLRQTTESIWVSSNAHPRPPALAARAGTNRTSIDQRN